MRKKTFIKKYGNTFVITFTSEEMKLNNLKGGDIVYITVEKQK